MKTTKRMLNRQKPHMLGRNMSSARLCTVELIQRRRCDKRMLHECGATVMACASWMNLVLYVGKCLRMSVVRYRSSPSASRFFLCSVSRLPSE